MDASTLTFIMKLGALLGKGPSIPVTSYCNLSFLSSPVCSVKLIFSLHPSLQGIQGKKQINAIWMTNNKVWQLNTEYIIFNLTNVSMKEC